LIKEAVAWWESLAPTHPFVDGNKAHGFRRDLPFLAINGACISVDGDPVLIP
jgi:prophage maintenance system killer protein